MTFQKWIGPLLVGGLVSIVALGCSSSSGSGSSSESDAGGTIHRMLDSGGVGTADDANAAVVYEGTTGKACAVDGDCNGDGGPGGNICSTGVSAMVTKVTVTPWPTPVCVPDLGSGTGNCDPAPGGASNSPVFCDGDPTDPTSPGLCVPLDNPPQTGRGLCYPKCTFQLNGTAATGCIGFDTCQPLEVVQDTTTNAITGYGFCFGTCQKDSDCSALGATASCQTDIGFCTTKKLTRTKALGDACSLAATSTDTTTGACYCDGDSATGLGYCTSSCVVGGTPCANGWVCDSDQSTTLDFGTGTPIPVTMQDPGFPGFCRPACSLADAGAPVVDAGIVADAAGVDGAVAEGGTVAEAGTGSAGACPPNSTCQSINVVGADCIP